ncbi:uncharacterized protein N7484_010061 [Penicillium longicatenatum]|uniref:uncharacterized protein n=1 Tax=Penicillium longicatenatum TaxID=1561947 RepID=UPI0025471B51|nr:uncharacterized protein N7484_010061 [Penicillium longicatenatum]KAJ5636748.1 hypothetical protein N7484_010061 [Penicillium longicatenatum]
MRDDLSRDNLMPTRSALRAQHAMVMVKYGPLNPQGAHQTPMVNPIRSSKSFKISLMCKWANCQKLFKSKGTLKRHVNTQHIDPHSFKCQSCNKSFSRRDNMEVHFRQVHCIRV